MAAKALVALLIGVCLCKLSVQSPPPFYSLQPAVEALSEREAQLALRNEIENGNFDDFIDSEDFNLNNDYDNSERERMQIPNRALGRYVARSGGDYDEFYPSDYRKRSMYRKRDGSVFRERSRAPNHQQQQALAEKFLRAIEEERQREEEEEYKKQLRNLWNRYQLEEGDMERELFDNEVDSEYGVNNDDRKKKRQKGGEVEVAPYWNEKRAPMLPWLPAQRKKRFPVTKRSPKVNNDLIIAAPETNEKVSKDLQGIFGGDKHDAVETSMKKKRSSDPTHALSVESSKKDVKSQMGNMHVHEPHKKQKRDASEPDDDEDADNDNVATEGDDDENDSDEDDMKKKKKKREAPKSLETVRSDAAKKTSSESKPFQWSNIFGLDRKKKSTGLIFHPLEESDRRRKRCGDGECIEEEDYNEEDYEDEDYRRKKKRSREEKLETMDRKLKNIENLIIEDTAKYYDNHDGSISPSEARALRNRVAERLATAYSLEKMRKAIGKLKESMELEKNLEKNMLIGSQLPTDDDDDKKKAKRVAIKKEKAEFNNNDHDIESPAKKDATEPKTNDLAADDESKKKKKRSQKKSVLNNLISDEAPMSESYMGGGRMSSECPLLDSIEKKCRGIDIMSGDSHQNLLDACGEHQLCYLCGDSELQCDYDYLNDAEEICGRDLHCKIAARQALSVLRNFGGSRIPQRECIRNPCLNMAMRSIAY